MSDVYEPVEELRSVKGIAPGPRAPWAEQYTAALDRTLLLDLSISEAIAAEQAYDDAVQEAKRLGVKVPASPYRKERPFDDLARSADEFKAAWDEGRAGKPELPDLDEFLTARMKGRRTEAVERSERAQPGVSAELAAGLTAVPADPVTTLVGGMAGFGRSKSIVGAVIRGGAANAVGEATLQPVIGENYHAADMPFGIKEASQNIAFAALFGGGLEGLGKAAPKTYAAMRRRFGSSGAAEEPGLQPSPAPPAPEPPPTLRAEPAQLPAPEAPQAVIRGLDESGLPTDADGLERVLAALERAGAEDLQPVIERARDDGIIEAARPADIDPDEHARIVDGDTEPAALGPTEEAIDRDRMLNKIASELEGDALMEAASWRRRGEEAPADPTAEQQLANLFGRDKPLEPDELDKLATAKDIRDGTLDPLQTAAIMRDDPSLVDAGMPAASPQLRQARGLAQLSPEAWNAANTGTIEPEYASIIGGLYGAHPDTHMQIMDAVAKARPENAQQAEIVIRDAFEAMNTATSDGVKGSVFDVVGDDFLQLSEGQQRMALLDDAMPDILDDPFIASEIAAYAGSNRERILNVDADRAAKIAADPSVITIQLMTRAGPVNDALARATAALIDGASSADARAGFLEELGELVERHGVKALLEGVESTDKPPTVTPEQHKAFALKGRNEKPKPQSETLAQKASEDIFDAAPDLKWPSGSWIVTAPDGRVTEFFNKADADSLAKAGWKVQLAADYLADLNRKIKEAAPFTNRQTAAEAKAERGMHEPSPEAPELIAPEAEGADPRLPKIEEPTTTPLDGVTAARDTWRKIFDATAQTSEEGKAGVRWQTNTPADLMTRLRFLAQKIERGINGASVQKDIERFRDWMAETLTGPERRALKDGGFDKALDDLDASLDKANEAGRLENLAERFKNCPDE